MVYIQQNDHNHRLLIAGFDWPPGLSLGRNPCDSSVSVFVPPLEQLRPATCFHMGMDEERMRGGVGGGRVGMAGVRVV